MTGYFDRLVGNDALRHRLGTEFSGSSFSHAYIIEGPRGSGKHTLAREIAKAAACLSKDKGQTPVPCGTCKFCRKIESGTCPDIITVSRGEDRATMGVDTVRAMRADVATIPNDLDVKVYIIEDAHTMTEQAQNAFLLTLEEPPSFVLFLLLTEDASALLETVRSRAPVFRMQPIEKEALRSYLLTSPEAKRAGAAALADKDPVEFEELLLLAGGKIGTALELLDPQTRLPQTKRRHAVKDIIGALSAPNVGEQLFLTLRGAGQNREELKALFSQLQVALRDLILLSKREHAPLLFFTDKDEALTLTDRLTVGKLFSFAGATEEAIDALSANANVSLTLTHLLVRLLSP